VLIVIQYHSKTQVLTTYNPCHKLHSAPYYCVCAEFLIPWPTWLHYIWWYKDGLLGILYGEKKASYTEVMSVRPFVFALDLSATTLSDFHENRFRKIHALLKGVNKCLMAIRYSWAHRISMWCLLGITSVVKSGSVKPALYLGRLMKFWPYILHFTSDLGHIRTEYFHKYLLSVCGFCGNRHSKKTMLCLTG
jgi:hypothetical protein